MSGYWNYYDETFTWESGSSLLSPDRDYTIQCLERHGVSSDDAFQLFNSGYICFKGSDVLIDRFYGGAISSIDFRTRFSPSNAKQLLTAAPSSRATLQKVHSIDELRSVVGAIKEKRNIVFRGQNKNHLLIRKINNPYLTIKDYGEVSLLPSLWRKMYNKNPQSFTEYMTLSLLEWSRIFYSAFDLEEIERRHKALLDSGEYVFTMSEMEDCSDEMLREFGKFRMDLSMGLNYNLLTTLTTLLQHYGLLSPVLDLTESLEVALFFATHHYENSDGVSSYKFVGSNSRQSVIYVAGFDKNEMERHNERDEFLKYLEPQRPKQQKCVVSSTNQYAINLPAYHLEKVILLDFDIPANPSGFVAADIFPGKTEDKFLKALFEKVSRKNLVTIFNRDDL